VLLFTITALDSFQHGLVERQILEVLRGLHQTKERRTGGDSSAASGAASPPAAAREAGSVCRRVIQAQDVCPICQEGLLEKKLPVSHCRYMWAGSRGHGVIVFVHLCFRMM